MNSDAKANHKPIPLMTNVSQINFQVQCRANHDGKVGHDKLNYCACP